MAARKLADQNYVQAAPVFAFLRAKQPAAGGSSNPGQNLGRQRPGRAYRIHAARTLSTVSSETTYDMRARPRDRWHRPCAISAAEGRMSLPETMFDRAFEPRIGRSVSLDHAARLLGVSRRTIYNRIRDGRLQTIRTIGGSQRVLLESVQDGRTHV
jgi:excisionase family DNA binding protein